MAIYNDFRNIGGGDRKISVVGCVEDERNAFRSLELVCVY